MLMSILVLDGSLYEAISLLLNESCSTNDTKMKQVLDEISLGRAAAFLHSDNLIPKNGLMIFFAGDGPIGDDVRRAYITGWSVNKNMFSCYTAYIDNQFDIEPITSTSGPFRGKASDVLVSKFITRIIGEIENDRRHAGIFGKESGLTKFITNKE